MWKIGSTMWSNYEPLNLMTWVIISWIYHLTPPRCHWQRKGLVRDPRSPPTGEWHRGSGGLDPTIFHTSWPQIMDSCGGHYITNPTQGTIFFGVFIPENDPTFASSLIPKNTGNLMTPGILNPFCGCLQVTVVLPAAEGAITNNALEFPKAPPGWIPQAWRDGRWLDLQETYCFS